MTVCKICGAATEDIGSKWGTFRKQAFHVSRCMQCHYAFVTNAWTDYAEIYSELYYAGKAADPLVDYAFELEHPQETVRFYEWRGIVTAVGSLIPVNTATQWLDFGCGNGGLVRYCRSQGAQAVGFEEGYIARKALDAGIPIVANDELAGLEGRFDVITAIEVLEHVDQPLDVLRQIRKLLKPGGLLFLTTGNAEPYRSSLLEWQYLRPEIHISLYEPESLRRALTYSGFKAEFRGYLPGFSDIVRFKILKNLKVRRRAQWEQILPWGLLSRAADQRFKISAHPIGWADAA